MRSIAITCAALLASVSAGCSFIDDFDKFKAGARPGEDSGEPNPPDLDADVPVDDGATGASDSGKQGDGALERDGSGAQPDAGVADGSASDGGAPAPRCGDGVVDSSRGEQCDDGNMIAGDGCEPVTCQRTPPAVCGGKSCDDGNVCTNDVCDAKLGCESHAIDNDNDGYSPGSCKLLSGLRGGDCNDTNAAINPGVLEICDGLDNNCDGMIDEGYVLLHCYPDLDGDGYANLEGMSRTLCACPSGTVAVASPVDKKLDDCWDDPKTGADVHPNQMKFFSEPYNSGPNKVGSYDYDCSGGMPTPEYAALGGTDCGVLNLLLCGAGTEGFVGTKAPACGESAQYAICSGTVLCSGTSEVRTQACH